MPIIGESGQRSRPTSASRSPWRTSAANASPPSGQACESRNGDSGGRLYQIPVSARSIAAISIFTRPRAATPSTCTGPPTGFALAGLKRA